MKTVVLLSVTSLLLLHAAVNAQNADILAKTDLKNLNKQSEEIKKEKKEDKKELKEHKKELRNLEDDYVSGYSKQSFYKDFGNINDAVWVKGPAFDEVTFTFDNQQMIAYYDNNAELVGTTAHKTFNDLPSLARKYIDRKYPGYTKDDVIFFNDNELNTTDMVLFGYPFDDADNYFVVLKKGNETTILRVGDAGNVDFFKKM